MIVVFVKYVFVYEIYICMVLDIVEVDLGFLRLDVDVWDKMDVKFIDYVVMEKVDNLIVVLFDGVWFDMGGWDVVWCEVDKLDMVVVMVGDVMVIDCENSLIWLEINGLEIVGIGLCNILVVVMEDVVFVVDMFCVQDVKWVVQVLIDKGVEQVIKFFKEYCFWGWFEWFVFGGWFQVKCIYVYLGEVLSLQSYLYRFEYWVVVEGIVEVMIGDDINLILEN